jgi:uncharacterized protein YuzE
MKLTYDKSADAAYIYLKYPINPGGAKKTIEVSDNINIDFNSKEKNIGIEILGASKILDKEILLSAQMA